MLTVPNLPLALPAVMTVSMEMEMEMEMEMAMAMSMDCGAAEAKRVSAAGAWGGCSSAG